MNPLFEQEAALSGPIDWVQDALAARKARQEVEAVLEKEKEAEERARQGMSWSQKTDVFLGVAKIGVITVPIALLGLVMAPALLGAGEALRGGGAAASEGARMLSSLRKNPLPLPWNVKRRHLFALRDRYWRVADVPSLSRNGGTPGQWFFQGVGQGINDACVPMEQCFNKALFKSVLRNQTELIEDARGEGNEQSEAYHRGYMAGMKATIEYLSKPAYGPPQVKEEES